MERPTKPSTASTCRSADDEPEMVQPLFWGRISGNQVVGPTARGKTTLPPPVVLAEIRGKGK